MLKYTHGLHLVLNKDTICAVRHIDFAPKISQKSIEINARNHFMFFGSPERFSLPFWDRKFQENLLKIILKPTCAPKVAQRWQEMMRRWFQRPPRGSKTAPLMLQKALKRVKFGSTMLSRRPFSTPTQDSQLTIRSLQLGPSTIISIELQDNCSEANAVFTPHDSQFAAQRKQLPWHWDIIVATYHVSKLVVHIQLLIVHRSRFAACCSYVQ